MKICWLDLAPLSKHNRQARINAWSSPVARELPAPVYGQSECGAMISDRLGKFESVSGKIVGSIRWRSRCLNAKHASMPGSRSLYPDSPSHVSPPLECGVMILDQLGELESVSGKIVGSIRHCSQRITAKRASMPGRRPSLCEAPAPVNAPSGCGAMISDRLGKFESFSGKSVGSNWHTSPPHTKRCLAVAHCIPDHPRRSMRNMSAE